MRLFPKGTAVIDMSQASARLIAYLLEPRSSDSFLYWGFMNIIFEQKEYAETYVMEKMAREMIAINPKLKEDFEQEKKANPAMSDHWVQTNWFYQHTPYFDTKVNQYPIGKLFKRQDLQSAVLSEKPVLAF
jgi:ABC-type metal ion transport system substrate-binding protein